MIKNRTGAVLAKSEIFLNFFMLPKPNLIYFVTVCGLIKLQSIQFSCFWKKCILKTFHSLKCYLKDTTFPPCRVCFSRVSVKVYKFYFIDATYKLVIWLVAMLSNSYLLPAPCQRCLSQRDRDGSVHWPIYSTHYRNLSVFCQRPYW